MNKTDINISIITWLKNQTEFRWKYMVRKHVYRVTKIGKPQDGWGTFNAIKKHILPIYVKEPTEEACGMFNDFFGGCFHVYGKYVEIDG